MYDRIQVMSYSEKTVSRLAGANFDPEDLYHQNIKNSALRLFEVVGQMAGTFDPNRTFYLTQWGSGTTLWKDDFGYFYQVSVEGKVEIG